MRTAIYVFLLLRTPLYASLRGRHRENIEKLCVQLCEALCNKEEGSQSYAKDSTK